MRFQKGKSGNPGGRPKKRLPDGRSLVDLAKEHTETAVLALVEIVEADDAPHAAKVSAATALLDRAWGRPAQAVQLTGADGGPIQTEEVNGRDVLLSRIAGIAARADTPKADRKPH